MRPMTHALLIANVLLIASPFARADEGRLNNVTGGAFQGNWEHCDRLNDARWGKGTICGGYVLLQNDQNICGTWSYWASGTTYEGQLQMTAIRNKTAKKDRICGTPGSETQTECANEYTSDGGWEAAKGYTSVCNNALQESDTPNVASCSHYYPKKQLHQSQVKTLLAEPWMQQCLSRSSLP